MLDLATGKSRTPRETEVRKYKGKPKPENLVETTITRTKEEEEALEAIRQGRARPLERFRNIVPRASNPGMFFMPRP